MSVSLAALGNRTPEQLKVAELREELRKRGVQIKGLKKDLVDRLEEVLKQEELEQQKALAAVINDAAAASVPADQFDPVAPVIRKNHCHYSKEEAKDIAIPEPDNAVVASVRIEVTSVVPVPPEEDSVFSSEAESLAGGSDVAALSVAGGTDGTAATPVEGEPMPATIVLSVPAGDDLSVRAPSPVDNAKTTTLSPALEDLVADLERLEDPSINKVLQEEQQVQLVEEETRMIGVGILSGKSTDIATTVGKGVDEVKGETGEAITTTFVKTLTAIAEEQVVSVVSDQNVVTLQEEQVLTARTRVATAQKSANTIVIAKDTNTTVATLEKTTTTVADGEGVKLDTEAVRLLEDKSDLTIGEESKEVTTEVANEDSVAETPKDETLMDVDAGTGKESTLEKPKDELPMAVGAGNDKGMNMGKAIEETPMHADTQKGSKRTDTDGERITLEPIKRRRWNSTKGEVNFKSPGKYVKPLEFQESVPSNAPIPSAKVQTLKSAPPEKVAVIRTTTRAEDAVNGENQKTRVVPPSAKPSTTSLKIDKFLRPFTFKAVKELLAQTGTVQDVWMDQIKTHCYVTYSSVEEASATRNALFNLQWPPQGGRLLTAEFVDPSEVKLRSDGEIAAAAAGPTATATPATNAVTSQGHSTDGSKVLSTSQPSTPASSTLLPSAPLPFPPRDRFKHEVERTPTLDDLFRKTRSKPHIYYLPLTVEEVAVKVAARD